LGLRHDRGSRRRGWLIDHLIARGYDETPVRKTVLILGMLLGLAVFGATVTEDPVWAIVWISVALSGLAAAAPVGWSIPSLIAPRGGTGTISGIMNFLNNMMGVVAPLATRRYRVLRRSISHCWYRAGDWNRRLRLHTGSDRANRRSAHRVMRPKVLWPRADSPV
jgi:hypothetical protein